MDGKCRSVATRRYASLDRPLFIRIEKIVTGWLDIVEIPEFEWLRAPNNGARVHPALLLRIATVPGNGVLEASTLYHQHGDPETN
jgi:hypothetical protein